jgi:nucleotide-binding universal stress UspA family protein
MKKKVLIALDDSRHSNNAIQYAADLYQQLGGLSFELFHVQPMISQYLLDEAEKQPKARAELNKVLRKNREAAGQLVESATQHLVRLGVVASDVEDRTLPRTDAVEKEILEHGASGKVDAILMGRRGGNSLSRALTGSVSTGVVENSAFIPVWLVDEKTLGSNMMVAVDGSESALRAVDHLAFMAGGNLKFAITFFHVTPRLQDFCPVDFTEEAATGIEEAIFNSDRHCIDRFYGRARQILTEAGVAPERIATKEKRGALRTGKAILAEYRSGKYGTLVVGRRGMNRKSFTGSVSRQLINQFSDGALWVVP